MDFWIKAKDGRVVAAVCENHMPTSDILDAMREMGNAIEYVNTDKSITIGEVWPRPRTERKEVKQWAVVDSTNGRIWNVGTKEEMEIACDDSPTNLLKIVELIGYYDVPVKEKVKKRIEIPGINLNGTDFVYINPVHYNKKAKFFAEWEE